MTTDDGPLTDRDDLLRITRDLAQTLAGILAAVDDIARTFRRLADRSHLSERSGLERPEPPEDR
jgi:hypothetical protein